MEPMSSGILLLSPVGRVSLQNSKFNPMAFCVVTVPSGQKLGVDAIGKVNLAYLIFRNLKNNPI